MAKISLIRRLRNLSNDTVACKTFYRVATFLYKKCRNIREALFVYIYARNGKFQSASWGGFRITETHYDPYVREILFGDMQRWKKQQAIFRTLIFSKDPVVFDVGANVGFVSLLLSQIKGITIYSFEPVSLTFECLKKNVEQNNTEMIHPFHIGFSDQEQHLFIGPPSGDQHARYKKGNKKTGLYSVHASQAGRDAKTFGEIARFTTMDIFCEKNQIKRLDYIKIDVEGHEINVLKGGMNVLKKFQPVCQVEFHPIPMHIAHREPKEIFDFFQQLGYGVFIWKNETYMQICLEDLYQQGRWITTELYCVPKRRLIQIENTRASIGNERAT